MHERLGRDLFEEDGVEGAVGRYVIRREIGRGGTAVVYEGYDPALGRSVAVKVLQVSDPAVALRFSREAVIAAGLHHPGIVAVHDHAIEGGCGYLVMELVEGRPLSEWMGHRPLPEILKVLEDAARAVHCAHAQGVIHRDLKPQNILVGREVKVVDFGLARFVTEGRFPRTRTGAILGTPPYMAPEQIDARRGVQDARTDVHALGVMAYEAATGRRPFTGETVGEIFCGILSGPPRLEASIPRDLRVLIEKAMDPEPGRRYASAKDFADEVRRFLSGEPIQARAAGPVERMARSIRRRPQLWIAASLLVVGSVAAMAASWRAAKLARQNEQLSSRIAEAPLLANEQDELTRKGALLHRQARERGEASDYSAAIETLERVLAANPVHVRARCELASVYLSLAKSRDKEALPRAEAECDRILRINDRLAFAWRMKGEIRQLLSDESAAEECYTRAIETDPKFHRAWMDRAKVRASRARVLQSLDGFLLAESDAVEALRLHPDPFFSRWLDNLRGERSGLEIAQSTK